MHFNELLFFNGHGIYIWPAYSVVLLVLFIQWFIPYKKWRRYLKEQRLNDE